MLADDSSAFKSADPPGGGRSGKREQSDKTSKPTKDSRPIALQVKEAREPKDIRRDTDGDQRPTVYEVRLSGRE